MGVSDERVTVRMPSELIENIDECYDNWGFESRSAFIRQAIVDAVVAEDQLTEEARKGIQRARERFENEGGEDIEPVFEELGLEFDA